MTPCDDPYPWLSDFLCDYVDGAMPPSEQAAFEEWLRGDPALAVHVAHLVQARRWCCQSEAPKAPCDFVAALHRRLVAEGLEEAPAAPELSARPLVRGTVRRVRASAASAPSARFDAASPALLMRSALLLIVLSAVVMARFGLHAEAQRASEQTALQASPLTSEQLAVLAEAPVAAAEEQAAVFTVRRPSARLVRTHAAERGAVRSGTPRTSAAPFRQDVLLRIRAGSALVP